MNKHTCKYCGRDFRTEQDRAGRLLCDCCGRSRHNARIVKDGVYCDYCYLAKIKYGEHVYVCKTCLHKTSLTFKTRPSSRHSPDLKRTVRKKVVRAEQVTIQTERIIPVRKILWTPPEVTPAEIVPTGTAQEGALTQCLTQEIGFFNVSMEITMCENIKNRDEEEAYALFQSCRVVDSYKLYLYNDVTLKPVEERLSNLEVLK